MADETESDETVDATVNDDEAVEEAKVAAAVAEQALEAVEAEAAVELPASDEDGLRPNRRKVREGMVVSDGMTATVVVAVVERVRHPKYGKTVQRTKKLYVHDAEDTRQGG